MTKQTTALSAPKVIAHALGMTVAQEAARLEWQSERLRSDWAKGEVIAWDVARDYAEGQDERLTGWSERAQEITGLDRKTLEGYAAMYRRWGASRRHPITFYRAVRTLDDKTALQLLDKGLSQVQLYEEVRKVQQVAGLSGAQLAKVDKVVAQATREAHAYRDANRSSDLDIPTVEREARASAISDLRAGVDIQPRDYMGNVGIDELKGLARAIVAAIPGVAPAAGGIAIVREAAVALTDLVARFDALSGTYSAPRTEQITNDVGVPGSLASRAAWEADKGKAAKVAHDLAVVEREN